MGIKTLITEAISFAARNIQRIYLKQRGYIGSPLVPGLYYMLYPATPETREDAHIVKLFKAGDRRRVSGYIGGMERTCDLSFFVSNHPDLRWRPLKVNRWSRA